MRWPHVALAAAIVVATACSSGGSDEPAPLPAAAPPATTTRPPPPTTSDPSPEMTRLTDQLLTEAPLPGFRRDDARLGAGPLDLEAAARAEADAASERALLETRHFVRGSSRAWLDADDDVVYVALYEFARPADAEAYLRDGTETLIARAALGFLVPEIPGAIGFTSVDEGGGGSFTTHSVAFTVGERWALVIVGSQSSGRTPDDARAVAVAQRARLG